MTTDAAADVRARLQRADELRKAAASRNDPSAARQQAEEVLIAARALLPDVAGDEERMALAAQIARRMADIDRAVILEAAPAPDVARAPTSVTDPARVPPGQHLTPGWPVLHTGSVPRGDAPAWRFTLTGLVERRRVLDWEELQALPTVTVTSDFHCVTGWSRLGNTWTGVRCSTLIAAAGPRMSATHALVYGHQAYSANLPLDALLDEDALFAWAHDGQPLSPEHGGPLRLVVPKRYAWKSVKWATELRLLDRDVPGYWEERGYHNDADPWREQRFAED